MIYEYLFLKGLGLTIVAELVAGLVLRHHEARLGFFKGQLKKVATVRYVVGISMATLMTLPYVWFVFIRLISYKPAFVLVAELFAWLVEAVLYRYLFEMKPSRAVWFSFILNAFSFLFGLVITRIGF